jgi:hypothetical protein
MPGEKITCGYHGDAYAAIVCQHLLEGSGSGFFCEQPTDDDPWPDALCRECDDYFRAFPEWHQEPDALTRLAVVCHHCYEAIRDNTRESASPEFDSFLEECLQEMELKNAAHERTWGAKVGTWEFDQALGELVIRLPDQIGIAPAQVIGSFSARSSTWMWAWANHSLSENLKAHSRQVREYGQRHRLGRLTTPVWDGHECDVWKMAALACKLCEAEGVYRGPSGPISIFMTFGEINWRKVSATPGKS